MSDSREPVAERWTPAPSSTDSGSAPAATYQALRRRIHEFVRQATVAGSPPPSSSAGEAEPNTADFDTLAREVLSYQAQHLVPIATLWESRGVAPPELADWRAAPPVPTAAFKSFGLHTVPAERIFNSSGTTRGEAERSQHHHTDLDLYRLVVDQTFPHYVLRDPASRPAVLSLVPPAPIAPDSSLAFMVEHVLERFSARGSSYAYGAGGLHPRTAIGWLRERSLLGEPVLILSTAIALWDLIVELEQAGDGAVLPPDSVIFETGGFKTSEGQIERRELVERIEQWLGVPPQSVVREYGMTELTSQAYSEVLRGGAPDRLVVPPWVRVRILDPQDLTELPFGETGLVSILELGNLGSAAYLLTEDLAEADSEGGFELRGRAQGAQLRGCSLLGEQLRST